MPNIDKTPIEQYFNVVHAYTPAEAANALALDAITRVFGVTPIILSPGFKQRQPPLEDDRDVGFDADLPY